MSTYLEEAKKLRSGIEGHYNCAQAVLIPFAQHFGMSKETAARVAANFGSGMKMGATCGAVTGGLMALGLAGIDDAGSIGAFCREIRNRHEGCLDCRDLLRITAEKGGDKSHHCTDMVYECLEAVEEIMRSRGLL